MAPFYINGYKAHLVLEDADGTEFEVRDPFVRTETLVPHVEINTHRVGAAIDERVKRGQDRRPTF